MAYLLCFTVWLLMAAIDARAPDVRVVSFAWLSHVSGSCWHAELSPGETADTQCFNAQFGRVMRVDQKIVQGASTLNADSLYAWDPRTRKVRHVFWAADGSFETASGRVEGDSLILYLDRETDSKGDAAFRTVLRPSGPDAYVASRQRFDGARWVEQFSFTYRRVQAE